MVGGSVSVILDRSTHCVVPDKYYPRKSESHYAGIVFQVINTYSMTK